MNVTDKKKMLEMSLRQRAEAIARHMLSAEANSDRLLSPVACQTTLHELRVHQIELEMQNEVLRDTQETIEELRDRLIDFYEHTPAGYLTVSDKGLVVDINLTGAALLGKDRKNILQHRFSSFVIPTDVDRYHSHYFGALKTADKRTCELGILRGEGVHVHVRLDSLRIVKDGQPPALRVVLTDITASHQAKPERYQHSQQLEELTFQNEEKEKRASELGISEARLHTIFSTINDLIWLKNIDGVYLSCNPMFERFFGAKIADIIGKTDYDFVDKELADLFRENDRIAIFQGGSHINEEWVIFADDGHRALLETTKTPMHDPDGNLIGVLGISHDITERKRKEEKLQLAASVFANAREGIMITDLDGTIIEVNDAFSRITGYSSDDVIGQNPRILSSGHQDKLYYTGMWHKLVNEGHWYGEVWNRRKSGEVYAEMQTISTVYDLQGKAKNFVALFSDITITKKHQKNLEHIAHYDALTSLPNRLLFADRLHQAMAQSGRRKKSLAVIFLDLDGFKAINDNHGHEVGDQLLITVARRMKDALREGDTLARFGGDEFVGILADLPDVTFSETTLLRLLTAAAQPVFLGDLVLQVSASIGVTFYPQAEPADEQDLLRQADAAMYQAKDAGKNRYCMFDAGSERCT